MSLGECGFVIGGLTKNAKRESLPLKRPYLRVANVYENRLELTDIKDIGVAEGEIDKTSLEDGDLLIVEGNGSLDQIGRVAMWRNEISNCLHQNHLIKFRADRSTVIPEFALICLMSPSGKSEIAQKATSAAGLYTLSISKVSGIAIEVPGLDEQKEIVRRVEELFAIADRIEAQYRAARARVDRLTQSLLAKAFRGELVPQDPNDEPATALLERIRAQRAAAPKPKRGRYRKAAIQELPMVAEAQGSYTRKMSRRSQSGKKSK
jgi:type I restriction enzyme S subunit